MSSFGAQGVSGLAAFHSLAAFDTMNAACIESSCAEGLKVKVFQTLRISVVSNLRSFASLDGLPSLLGQCAKFRSSIGRALSRHLFIERFPLGAMP